MKLIYIIYFTWFFGLSGCRSKEDPSETVTNVSSSSNQPSLSSEQSTETDKRKTAFYLYLLDANVPKIYAPYASISSDEEFELAQIQLLESYADEMRSDGLNLQNAGKALVVLRRIPGSAAPVAARSVKKLPPPSTPKVIELPSGLTSSSSSSGFSGTFKSIRDEANKQAKLNLKKSEEKTTAEGVADATGETAGTFIKTMAEAGDPSAAAIADIVTAISKSGSSVVLYGKEATKTFGGGAVKFTSGLAAGGGVAGGVVGVTSQAIFNAGLSVSKHSPQLRGLFNKIVELRTLNPGRSYSQIVKQLEGSPDFKTVLADLRSSSKKVKEDFFNDVVSGLFFTLMFSKGFKAVSKAIKKNPNNTTVSGEFDELTLLQRRDDQVGIIDGLGITQKEVSDMLAGITSLRGDLGKLGGTFLRKIKKDADDFLENFQRNEGLSLTDSGDDLQLEVMMLLVDEEGRPLVVLFDSEGNVLRTGQDTMHILYQDEYLRELLEQ